MGGKGATAGLGQNITYSAGSPIYGYTQTNVSSPTISYSPLYDQGTYTDATRAVGQTYLANTSVSTSTSVNGLRSCILNNGNIVFFYSATGGFYFSIYTPAGVQVKAETNISASAPVSGIDALDVAAMPDGGFVVVYGTSVAGGTGYIQRFNSAGTNTLAQTSIGGQFYSAVSIAAFTNGSYAVCGITTNSTQLRYFTVSAANVVGGTITPGSPTSTTYNVRAVTLTNGNVAITYNLGSSNVYFLIINSAGTAIVAPVSAGVSTGYTNWDVCTTPTGFAFSFMLAANNHIYAQYVSNAGVIGTAIVVVASAGSGKPSICYGGNNTVYIPQISTNLRSANVTNVGVGTLVSSGVIPLSPAFANLGLVYASVSTLNGAFAAIYINTVTGAASFQTLNQQTYTQNVTVLTGNTYTPATNYYFLGVATNSAAAGNIVNVQVNGVTALPSTYPSVTSPISFDYQNGASPFAQRGTVSGRNIILKGLE
jgi:hypothetical protein